MCVAVYTKGLQKIRTLQVSFIFPFGITVRVENTHYIYCLLLFSLFIKNYIGEFSNSDLPITAAFAGIEFRVSLNFLYSFFNKYGEPGSQTFYTIFVPVN